MTVTYSGCTNGQKRFYSGRLDSGKLFKCWVHNYFYVTVFLKNEMAFWGLRSLEKGRTGKIYGASLTEAVQRHCHANSLTKFF